MTKTSFLPAPDKAESAFSHPVQDNGRSLYSFHLPADVLTVPGTARRTLPLGTLGVTSISVLPSKHRLVPASLPSKPAADLPVQVPLRKDNTSTKESTPGFALLPAKHDAWGRATPPSPKLRKSHAHSILLKGRLAGTTGTFSYYKVPAPSGETPTSFLTGST